MKTKRIISFILTLVMVTSTLIAAPFPASAYDLEPSGQIGDNVYYTFDESTGAVTITGTGDTWDFEPYIDDDDFESPFCVDNDKVKTVTIGDGVTSIGDRLFRYTYITDIKIPDSVTRIGEYAFEYSGLTAVIIPDSVTSIGDCAFENCFGLTKVVISGSLKSIPVNCFYDCNNLKEVYIGKGVEKVESSAFYIRPGSPIDVYYSGSEEEWAGVTVERLNEALLNANMHYNTPLPAEYDLWVGGAQVTSDNLSGEGWIYAPETNTLTLDGFTYSGPGHEFTEPAYFDNFDYDTRAAITYLGTAPLNLVVKNENSVTQNGGEQEASAGIYSLASVNVSGDGKLNVTGGTAEKYSSGIWCAGEVNVNGGNIKALGGTAGGNGDSIGIFTDNFNMAGGEVWAEGGTGHECFGVKAKKQFSSSVTVTGGKLTCRGGNSDYIAYGIYFGESATFSGGTVDAVGAYDRRSYGIESNRRGGLIHVCEGIDCFVAAGTAGVVWDYAVIKNDVAGMSWSEFPSDGEGEEFPVHTDGTVILNSKYRKIEINKIKNYDLWVGETEVTSRHLSGEGWSYAPETNTLTLDNFNYKGKGHRDGDEDYSAIYSAGSDGLTLDLKGTSTVEETGDNDAWLAMGVYSKGKMTVTGDGTINATGSGGCHNIGIYSRGDIVIDGGTVNAVAEDVTEYDYNSYGIYSNGSITINGGTVKGTGGAAPDGYSGGFFAYYDITVNGGSVTGTGGSARFDSWGFFSYSGNISINELSGEKPTSVVAAGNSRAIESIYVKNSISGMGWNDASGEGDGTFIPVNTEGTSYDYRKVVFPHVHSFTVETVDDKYLAAAATCTEPAKYYKLCSVCGEPSTTDTFTSGSPLGHDFTSEVVDENYLVSAADCTNAAVYCKSCSRCGLAGTDTFATGDPLGHDLGEWKTTKEPTCLDKGMKRCECSRCDYFEEEPVEALGHDFTSEVAEDEYLASAADCTNAATYYKSCERCGLKGSETFESGKPLGHAYMHVLTNPTCTEQGYTTHTCSRCGDEYVDSYKDALGHDMGDWETVTEPTCTDAGTKIKRCTRCTYTEDGVIPALEHDYEYKVAEATCEADGYTRYTCTRCGDTYDDNLEPALGHDMGEWKTAKEPTCTDKGTKIRYCSRCDYSEDGTVDPLGHDFAEEFTEDVAPTETTTGIMSRHCSRCSEVTDVTEIPKILLGDVNGDGAVNMKDILLLRKAVAGMATIDLRYRRNADLDFSGDVTMKDVLQLRRMIAGT